MSDVTSADSAPNRRSPPPPSPSPSMPRFQQQPSGRQPPPPGADPFAFGVVAFIGICFVLVSRDLWASPTSLISLIPTCDHFPPMASR